MAKIVSNKETKKISIKDILILIGIVVLVFLKHTYFDIEDIKIVANLNNSVKTIIFIVEIVGWLMIAIICGSYQDKVEKTNIKISTVTKDMNKYSRETSISNKLIDIINALLRISIVLMAGMIPNMTIALSLVAISTLVAILSTMRNKFKIMDIAYTLYTIGMLTSLYSVLLK